MAGKDYEIAFKIGGKVQSSFGKAFSTIQKNLQAVNNRLNQTEKQAQKASKSMNSMEKALKATATAAGAYMGISAVKGFASDSVEAAKAQIDAETKLAAVMRNTKGVTDAQIQAVKDYASELQGIGVIGDEVALSGVQQMATFQLQADTLNTLMPGMENLLAQQKGLNATQQDSVTIGTMIGKAMTGQAGALSRVGINFTKAQEQVMKFGTEEQKAATLAEILEMNVGGVNKALAETDQGEIQQMTNTWGDMKEEIGKGILPMQAKFAGWFVNKIPRIQRTILSLMDKIKTGAKSISGPIKFIKQTGVDTFNAIRGAVQGNKPALDNIREAAGNLKENLQAAFEDARPTIEWLKDEGIPAISGVVVDLVGKVADLYNYINDHWSAIKPFVEGITLAFLGWKAVVFGLDFAIKIITATERIFNAVTRANPIGVIVTLIGVAIGLGIALYQNWDKIKAKAIEVWAAIKDTFSGVGEWFCGVWSGIVEGFQGAWKGISSFFVGIFDGIVSVFKGYANVWIGIVNFLIGGLNKIKFDVPDWVPGIGGKKLGINIPLIPQLAKGTDFFKGGLAMVGERGPELLNLPRGSQVTPNKRTETILNSLSSTPKKHYESQAIQITWSPQYIIQGNSDMKVIERASKQSQDDFEKRMEKIFSNRKRVSFAQ